MSALGTFLESKKIKSESLFWASARIEARSEESSKLEDARETKRRTKTTDAIAKPTSGRGFSRKQLAAALAGEALPRRARAKVLRGVNALLEKNKEPAVTMKDLFGEEKARVGKAKVDPKAAKK